jgi:hypothetical protein
MADLRKGIPIDYLIGEPLRAVMRANLMAAESAREYLERLIIDKHGAPNMIDFSFERPGKTYMPIPETTDQNGEKKKDQEEIPPWKTEKETVKISVPMLAIVPIPNLQVDELNLSFDMEIKSISTAKGQEDYPNLIGTVSSPKEFTRRTDSSAKFHVDLKATNHGIPEGLARVLDVIVSKIGPHKIEAAKTPSQGSGERDNERAKETEPDK